MQGSPRSWQTAAIYPCVQGSWFRSSWTISPRSCTDAKYGISISTCRSPDVSGVKRTDKERILPVSRSLQQRLSTYMELAYGKTHLDTPFFYAKTFQPYSHSAVHSQFKGFLWDVGITYRGKDLGPRIHDLRHPNVKAKTQFFKISKSIFMCQTIDTV